MIQLLLAVLSLAFSTQAWGELRLPHNLDLTRLKKIDAQMASAGDRQTGRSQKLAVFTQMTAIDERDARLLFPAQVGSGLGTPEQLRQRFETAISATGRFNTRSERQTDVIDGIVVEGMITAANQNLEDYRAFLKSVTTVRMSVAVKDLTSGEIIRSRNLTAVYGAEEGEGTLVMDRQGLTRSANGECAAPDVCRNLANDYDKAMEELLEGLAAYIERTFRPIAKVYDVSGGIVTLLGGVEHGFNAEEQVVVFRAKQKTSESGRPLQPVTIPIARLECSVGDNMTCRVIEKGEHGDVQEGDYAIPTTMKFKRAGRG